MNMTVAEERALGRFQQETSKHEMQVLRDDGLYRHIRFRDPTTICYYFDLVTWPGYLAIVGDAGDFLFSRTRDMFEFFEGDHGINPQYWGEKLQGSSNRAQVYSHDRLRASVLEWADHYCEDYYEDEYAIYPSLVKGALEREILDGHTHNEHEARERLELMEEIVEIPLEAWEWDLQDFEYHFLWCCWAILSGIRQYREAQALAVKS